MLLLLLCAGLKKKPHIGGPIPADEASSLAWFLQLLGLIFLPRAALMLLLPGMDPAQGLLYGAAGVRKGGCMGQQVIHGQIQSS